MWLAQVNYLVLLALVPDACPCCPQYYPLIVFSLCVPFGCDFLSFLIIESETHAKPLLHIHSDFVLIDPVFLHFAARRSDLKFRIIISSIV